MASGKKSVKRTAAPGTTAEGEETRVVSMAYNLAKKQISDGTVSSQVLTHFLKLGSEREKLEREKLEQENELIRAKVESLESVKRTEDLYRKALDAMRSYSGQDDDSNG